MQSVVFAEFSLGIEFKYLHFSRLVGNSFQNGGNEEN